MRGLRHFFVDRRKSSFLFRLAHFPSSFFFESSINEIPNINNPPQNAYFESMAMSAVLGVLSNTCVSFVEELVLLVEDSLT